MADGFIVWEGLKAFEDALTRISAEADAAAKSIVTKGAAIIEAKAKANFSGAHKRGEPHVGGDKPNVVTGSLRRSIRHYPVVRHGVADYGTSVFPSAIYARRVELGYSGSHAVAGHTRKIKGANGKTRKVTVSGHTRTIGNADGTGGQQGYPYFTPAYRDAKPELEALARATWAKFLHP